jgi:hypothetical protein
MLQDGQEFVCTYKEAAAKKTGKAAKNGTAADATEAGVVAVTGVKKSRVTKTATTRTKSVTVKPKTTVTKAAAAKKAAATKTVAKKPVTATKGATNGVNGTPADASTKPTGARRAVAVVDAGE